MRARSAVTAAVLGAGLILFPQQAFPRQAQAAPGAWPGLRTSTNVVEYLCTTAGVTAKQDVKVRIELTMPSGALPGDQLTIQWHGTYVTGSELKAPGAGLPTGAKLYAYASISDFPGLTSATGVADLDPITPHEIIPLPADQVPLRTTANTTGTGTVLPAALNIGTTPTDLLIECDVSDTAGTTPDTLTVGTGTSASESPTATTSPEPTQPISTTVTETATPTPTPPGTDTTTPTAPSGEAADPAAKVHATPVGAAQTGGGGEAGPDGRTFILAGLLLILAAVTGLALRRRAPGTRR